MFDVALKLCGLASIGLFGFGVLALISPRRLARSYGVEARDRAALVWVRATGVRDVALGIILAYVAYTQAVTEIFLLCIIGLALAITDFFLAVTFARRLRSEHGAHLGGAIAFLVIIVLFLLS